MLKPITRSGGCENEALILVHVQNYQHACFKNVKSVQKWKNIENLSNKLVIDVLAMV